MIREERISFLYIYFSIEKARQISIFIIQYIIRCGIK